MKLPEVTPVTEETAAAIAARHGLRMDGFEPLAHAGIINSVFALGQDYVLRVPRNHPAHATQARREAAAIPLAAAAGVRTPRLIAFDDSGDILPVPYLVVERIRGTNLESLALDPPSPSQAWHELGRDLARLHIGDGGAGAAGGLESIGDDEVADPRALVERRVADGWISSIEARRLERWLDRLAPYATRPGPNRIVHADVQMSNLLVDRQTFDYRALIDWGCAARADSAFDFLAMPMAAVPLLLAAHREVAPLDDDDAAEARILWRRLQLTLGVLPRGAAPGCSWGERPVAWLLDLVGFFLDPPPPEPWRSLGPGGWPGGR